MTQSDTSSIVMQIADNILEKLKCLNYEEYFVKSQNQNPLGREQLFLPSPNTSLQFQYFVQLTSWLISLITKQNKDDNYFQINPYDDPNTIVNKIMIVARDLGFDADFRATKLKIPYGEAVVQMLDFLTGVAYNTLEETKPGPIKYMGSYTNGSRVLSDEDNTSTDEEGILDDSLIGSDDEDTSEHDHDTFTFENEKFESDFVSSKTDSNNLDIIENSIDPLEWKNELERVGPRLKVANEMGGEGWRNHFSQIVSQCLIIQNEFLSTEPHISSIRDEVGEILERIQSREEFLNNQFSEVTQEYNMAKDTSVKLEELCHSASQNVSSLSYILTNASKELDQVKKQVDKKNSIMSDTSPIVQIKSALQILKKEIKSLDLRIGVTNHTIQTKLQESKVSSVHSDENEYLSFESESDED